MVHQFICQKCGQCCSHIRGMISEDEKNFLKRWREIPMDSKNITKTINHFNKAFDHVSELCKEDIFNIPKENQTDSLPGKMSKNEFNDKYEKDISN